MTWSAVVAVAAAAALAGLRWLRVAQREHYLAGSVTRFALRWWTASAGAISLGLVALAAAVAAGWWPPAVLAVAAVTAVGPPGLGLRGRSGALAWTPRLQRLAAATGAMVALALGVSAVTAPALAGLVALTLPLFFDLALFLLRPWERRLSAPWVERAASALERSGATVVAITGSYGKTSTKGYLAQMVSHVRTVVASPASFNNRMGLARAINENLHGPVEVFVAEMGTYGRGEIAEMCRWVRPQVSVITAIGPVHLERFGSEEEILAAKAEILEEAEVAVLNVDDPRLAALADIESTRRRVIRTGTSPEAEVSVRGGRAYIGGVEVGEVAPHAHPLNVACALGAAVGLGLDPSQLRGRAARLEEPEHRRTMTVGASGVRIIDDTYNSNPAGAAAALRTLVDLDVAGRRVVVTPGMVELGRRQAEENTRFAAAAAVVVDDLVIVGRTNRRALVAGARTGRARLHLVDDREAAVAWVRSHLGPDDAVLYENDLPDHYP